MTDDLDVCIRLTRENVARVIDALRDVNPVFRLDPARRPMPTDPSVRLAHWSVFLDTDLGALDLLDAIDGVGDYERVIRHTTVVPLSIGDCTVLDLDTLILAKETVGRGKDRVAVEILKALREEIRSRPDERR